MSIPTLQIIDPGLFTTVQDCGRYGYQRLGVPVSGAMDLFALRAANLLVGNDHGAACLEMTVTGPEIVFLSDTWIAVTGADLNARLDGGLLDRWQSVQISAGSSLTFKELQNGMRAYLAVAGGIDVPMVMGSRSTYIKGGIGGVEGRVLRKSDVIAAQPVGPAKCFIRRQLSSRFEWLDYGKHHEIRVILGPQHHAFDSEAIATFLRSTYTIAINSDRMGYRLEGPLIAHRVSADIVSDANPPGAVQIPGDGVPTILLADRGATGGYTKIATVIRSDLSKLAQALPNHTISFKAVTIEEAHRVYQDMEIVLDGIAGRISSQSSLSSYIEILVDGEQFDVLDEEGRELNYLGLDSLAKEAAARVTVDGRTYEFQVKVRSDGKSGK